MDYARKTVNEKAFKLMLEFLSRFGIPVGSAVVSGIVPICSGPGGGGGRACGIFNIIVFFIKKQEVDYS